MKNYELPSEKTENQTENKPEQSGPNKLGIALTPGDTERSSGGQRAGRPGDSFLEIKDNEEEKKRKKKKDNF